MGLGFGLVKSDRNLQDEKTAYQHFTQHCDVTDLGLWFKQYLFEINHVNTMNMMVILYIIQEDLHVSIRLVEFESSRIRSMTHPFLIYTLTVPKGSQF